MTVAKNAIGHIAMLARDGRQCALRRDRDEHGKLDRLIGGLQRAVLELRVLPLRGVFQRFSRLVREMSESLAKPVRLVDRGRGHPCRQGDRRDAVRAVAARRAQRDGSWRRAQRRARCRRESRRSPRSICARAARANMSSSKSRTMVEASTRTVSARSAVERGLATAETVAGMSEEAAHRPNFMPGFSTAADVTDLSGRGVGMDAVRASVERLGGRVRLETRRGAGSTVRFVLPFSVMMTRVMTVEAGGQWFGIPLDAVVEDNSHPPRGNPIRRARPGFRAAQSDRSPHRAGRGPRMGEDGTELRTRPL